MSPLARCEKEKVVSSWGKDGYEAMEEIRKAVEGDSFRKTSGDLHERIG